MEDVALGAAGIRDLWTATVAVVIVGEDLVSSARVFDGGGAITLASEEVKLCHVVALGRVQTLAGTRLGVEEEV